MARGPDQKKVIHKNSLKNLTPGRSGKNVLGKKLSDAFQEDIYALWQKKTAGKRTTKGQELLEKAADKSPMAFIKMVATIIPKEDLAPRKNEPSASDFAHTLMELNKKMGNGRAEVKDEEELEDMPVIDIQPFPTNGGLPVTLDDEDEKEEDTQ
jgi:hypothetical protein